MSDFERDYEPPIARREDVAGVGWYSPALFRALRLAGLDLAPSCADWDAWFATYQAAFVRLKNEGLRPLKIAVDPGDLARWLKAEGLEHALEHHDAYVAWSLERLLAELAEEA
jgi:hypothetical protein